MICITGKIGSGKSTVARFISKILGWEVIDVDEIGHEFLEREEVIREVEKVFGKDVIRYGRVDRSRLRKLVFEDEENLKKLEGIVHPLMADEVRSRVESSKNSIIDCALLVRMKLLGVCDIVITVISSYEVSRSRKPHLGDDEFESIWKLQEDIRPIGILIENEGDLESLKENVSKLIECLELSPDHRISR